MKSAFILAAFALSFASAAFADEAPRLACHGNEPFWSLYINSKQITLKHDARTEHDVVAPAAPMGQLPGYHFVYQTKTFAGAPATVVISKRQCSDYMSDSIYPYSVIYASGETVFQGCCVKNN